MTERARQSNASRRQERSVADYIVHRLAREGMITALGSPGTMRFRCATPLIVARKSNGLGARTS